MGLTRQIMEDRDVFFSSVPLWICETYRFGIGYNPSKAVNTRVTKISNYYGMDIITIYLYWQKFGLIFQKYIVHWVGVFVRG